jgi:CRP/FNR family transcriptional regulator
MALVDSAARNSFAIAMEDSLLTSISKADLKRIILQKPIVGLRLAKVIGERRRDAEQKLEDMVFKDVPSRLANLILNFYKKNGKNNGKRVIDMRLIHNDIANLIGSTRETTSANLSRFKREGLIDFDNHRIVVLDEKKLELISQGVN